MNTATARRGAVTAFLLVAAMLMGATLVGAAHFGDVDPNSVHAPGIEYVADAGITAGCGDGSNFCPGDLLRRDQMATFIHRLSGNVAGIDPSVNAHRLEGFSAAELMAAPDLGIEVVPSHAVVAAGATTAQRTATCPAGKVALGGGGTAQIDGWSIRQSIPHDVDADTDTASAWRVQFHGPPPAFPSSASAWVVCATAG